MIIAKENTKIPTKTNNYRNNIHFKYGTKTENSLGE